MQDSAILFTAYRDSAHEPLERSVSDMQLQGHAMRVKHRDGTLHCFKHIVVPRRTEDGLAMPRWLRAGSDVLVIMLTSKDATADGVVDLDLGADDDVAKSAELRERRARVRSVLADHPSVALSCEKLPERSGTDPARCSTGPSSCAARGCDARSSPIRAIRRSFAPCAGTAGATSTCALDRPNDGRSRRAD